jgi:hypothetical protein
MPSVGFEPAIPANQLSQVYVIDRAATTIDLQIKVQYNTKREINNVTYINVMIVLCLSNLLYILDKPLIRFVFQVTQKDLRSSLMMAGYCQNM